MSDRFQDDVFQSMTDASVRPVCSSSSSLSLVEKKRYAVCFDPGEVNMGMSVYLLGATKCDLYIINLRKYILVSIRDAKAPGGKRKKKQKLVQIDKDYYYDNSRLTTDTILYSTRCFVRDFQAIFGSTVFFAIEWQKVSVQLVKDIALALCQALAVSYPNAVAKMIDPLKTRAFWGITVKKEDYEDKKQMQLYAIRKALTAKVFEILTDPTDMKRIVSAFTVIQQNKKRKLMVDAMDSSLLLGYSLFNPEEFVPDSARPQMRFMDITPAARNVSMKFLDPKFDQGLFQKIVVGSIQTVVQQNKDKINKAATKKKNKYGSADEETDDEELIESFMNASLKPRTSSKQTKRKSSAAAASAPIVDKRTKAYRKTGKWMDDDGEDDDDWSMMDDQADEADDEDEIIEVLAPICTTKVNRETLVQYLETKKKKTESLLSPPSSSSSSSSDSDSESESESSSSSSSDVAFVQVKGEEEEDDEPMIQSVVYEVKDDEEEQLLL